MLLGVVAYDLIGILKILKMEGWVTSDEYNTKLRHEDDIVVLSFLDKSWYINVYRY
jgi:hypothetical protein